MWNTCLPTTCVDGIVQKYKVKVGPSGGSPPAPNIGVFSGMTLKFPGSGTGRCRDLDLHHRQPDQ